MGIIIGKRLASGPMDINNLNYHLERLDLEELSPHDIARTRANMSWGTEKENFAMKAMKSHLGKLVALQDFFQGTCLRESGFLSCDGPSSRPPFGHKVAFQGQEVDVMSLIGASPDGVLVNAQTGKPSAVFEAKCRSPFQIQNGGTPGTRTHDHE